MPSSTPSPFSRIATIGLRDAREATRDRFIVWAVATLTLAALVSLITGAIALRGDAATYAHAKALLLNLGKNASALAAPELYPLKLLRGTIEQIEIMAAVVALIAGYRAAAAERGRQTLSLILTRPLRHWHYLAAKLAGGFGLSAAALAVVFASMAMILPWVTGVALGGTDLLRLTIAWAAGTVYLTGIFALAFGLSLWLRSASTGLIYAFALWLLVVLVAPQIGDTMDPDNQVAGGIYAQLSVPKAEQDRIKASFKTYETIRDDIERASVTKHFERFTFAVLGIKDSYTGKPLTPILIEKRGDALFLLLFTLGLGGLVLLRPIDPDRLTKEN